MRTLGTVLMMTAAVAFIATPVAYHFRSRGHWRDTSAGWHFMSYMGVFALVMVLAMPRALFDVDLPDWVRPVVWLLIAIVAWWRLVVVFAEAPARREK